MNDNHLYPIALSDASDADIFATFQRAVLPQKVIEDLTTLLSSVEKPLAIRSSSLLEDSHFQPFAGVYSTYMVGHNAPKPQMLANVRAAIKGVYASVFFKQSKNYLNATQNLIDQEKMAIVIQEEVAPFFASASQESTSDCDHSQRLERHARFFHCTQLTTGKRPPCAQR